MSKNHAFYLLFCAALSGCFSKNPDNDDDTGDGISLNGDDADGDGYTSSEDCDDDDSTIHPGATEVCDGIDNDCDDEVDEDLGDVYYADADEDGYGDPDSTTTSCEQVSGYVPNSSDCDDADADAYPGNTEVCDDIDNDCDDEVDEDVTVTVYVDGDGDGFGDPDQETVLCEMESGYVTDSTDCDDADQAVYPGAVDEANADECMLDADGDGFGDMAPDDGYDAGTDCDDADEQVHPDAEEICDEIDNDCNELIDDEDANIEYSGGDELWYYDADEDGFGDESIEVESCEQPSGYVSDSTDCDDDATAVNPDADEECDDIDNDCDETVDEDDAIDALTWYLDDDGDGYGDPDNTTTACEQPSGYEDDDEDCDDSADFVNPSADEICNDGYDNDCDGSATPCTAELADAGHKIVGESTSASLGYSVSGAGDVDGDGYDDILIGAWKEDAYGDGSGAAYFIAGPVSSMPTEAVNADVLLYEMTDYAWVGTSVAEGGDFLDNGQSMVVVGAGQMEVDDDYVGAVFLSACETSDSVYLLSDQIMIYGEENSDEFGGAVSTGDFNADGLSDVLVGAKNADIYSGAAYVIEGDSSLESGAVEDLGVALRAESNGDFVGYALDVVDDMNGDGFDEALVGAYYEDEAAGNAGAVYLVHGPITAELDLADADSKMTGSAKSDHLGTAVLNAGDLNDDGVPDIALSASDADDGASNGGAVYVLFGPVSGSVSMDDADVVIVGDNASDHAGDSLAGGGDLDGDGVDDLVIGIPDYDGVASTSGGFAMFLGPLSSDASVSDAEAFWEGEAKSDSAAISLAVVGDVDADGLDDVLVGATGDDTTASNSGAAYLVMGVTD